MDSPRIVVLCFVIITALSIMESATKQNEGYNVVVVGGGLAGLSAVLTALKHGARVTLIDSEKDVGGNSAKATSGINAVGTETQQKLGIKDSPELFISDTMKSGDNLNKRELVETLVENSKAAIEWLIELGVPLYDINLLGGQSAARTHWIPSPKDGPPIPVGLKIIRTLKEALKKLDDEIKSADGESRLTMLMNTNVKELLFSQAGVDKPIRVRGVRVEPAQNEVTPEEIFADAVILTTGGFSNDHTENSLLKEFAPEKISFPTTNGAFATGAGVKMARKVGARLIHMDKVQIHPTAFVDPKDPQAYTKFLAAEALRGSGALLLNHEGKRFANELDRRDTLTMSILKNCPLNTVANAHIAYLLLNERVVDKYGWPAFNFYWKVKGFFKKFDNADLFAADIGVPFNTLKATFDDYNKIAKSNGELKDPFGKTAFPIGDFSTDETLYYALITPGLHYTMGGAEIDSNARVISESGAPIPGLFAAGEVSGGLHGENRLGGNSLLECVVFGRIAGQVAATGGVLKNLEHQEL